MSGAFPFRAARPKGSKPPSMSFELPAAPPAEEEIPFTEEATSPEAREEIEAVAEQFEQEEDVAKKRKPGRPKNPTPTPKARTPRDHTPKFTFAEVAAVFGEDVPFVKVVAKITPVIEILKPEDRKRVVDILVRLYG